MGQAQAHHHRGQAAAWQVQGEAVQDVQESKDVVEQEVEKMKPTNESLPGLLGAELDEGRAAHGEAEHVGHDVVDDHRHDRQDEPDQALGAKLAFRINL